MPNCVVQMKSSLLVGDEILNLSSLTSTSLIRTMDRGFLTETILA